MELSMNLTDMLVCGVSYFAIYLTPKVVCCFACVHWCLDLQNHNNVLNILTSNLVSIINLL